MGWLRGLVGGLVAKQLLQAEVVAIVLGRASRMAAMMSRRSFLVSKSDSQCLFWVQEWYLLKLWLAPSSFPSTLKNL